MEEQRRMPKGHVYGKIPKLYLPGGKKPAWILALEHPNFPLWNKFGFCFLRQIESLNQNTSSGRFPRLLALALAGAPQLAVNLTFADDTQATPKPALATPTTAKMISLSQPSGSGRGSSQSTTPLATASLRSKTNHPSVLAPKGKIPELSYADAISYLHAHNASTAATLSVPFPLPDREVDICIYDPVGMCLKVWNSGEMILTDVTTLPNLVLKLQALIDRCCLELDMDEKYLVLDIEMRVLNNGNMVGFPRIQGEPKWIGAERDGKKGAVVEGIIWLCDGGEMETYWDAYRRMMQIGDVEAGIKKPMLKIRTLKKGEMKNERLEGENLFWQGGGHFFVLQMKAESEARKVDIKAKGKFPQRQIQEQTTTDNMDRGSDNVMIAEIERQFKEMGNPLDISSSEVEFALSLINQQKEDEKDTKGKTSDDAKKSDAFTTYRNYLSKGGKPLKELAFKKSGGYDKSRPQDPERNWGKYQRMGGDEKMHKAFPLDHVPFEESEFPVFVGPEDPDYPDSGNDEETVKSLGDEADTSIKMVPYMTPEQLAEAAELAERKKINPSFPEAAIGFDDEDDKIFIPNIDKPPSPVIDPKKEAALKALRGAAPQHKKVESLRAIGLDKILGPPVVPRSSMHNSPYLNALGSSGVAPPTGTYNSFSSMAGNQSSGFQQAQAAYPNTMSQSSQNQWSNISNTISTPTLGFYDTMSPDIASSNMGMGNMGMSSNLSNIARTSSRNSSRAGFPQHYGSTPLRADSPAFQSTSSTNNTTYPSHGYGYTQQHGVGGQSGASVSGSGAKPFDHNANVDALSVAAKKWFRD